MKNLSILIVAPLLALCGCASPPQDQKVADAGKLPVECEHSYGTGSMMPKKECAAPLTAEERQRLQDELQNKARSNGSPPPGSGK